jgi:hypothetical protein
MIQREQIKELALANGFKLKQQPDGSEDLNPYVYEFADALVESMQAELERYSMSAGAADQFRREALAMRQALGFDKYGDDIAPVDLLNALDRRFAEAMQAAWLEGSNAGWKAARG